MKWIQITCLKNSKHFWYHMDRWRSSWSTSDIDIKNSIKLCKNKNYNMFDDIIKTNCKNKLTDNASYNTLNKLKI